jgi:3',5'-cyclic AMP phosphodiesterase CpdA
MPVRIAVVSDLHCHHSRKFYDSDSSFSNSSFLTTDLLRAPTSRHTVESLLELIKKEQLSADFLTCPGDITNQVDIQGFISGWGYVKEIAENLKVAKENIIATLGNHDVDSRFNISPDDVFMVAQGIGNGFPFAGQEMVDIFWAKGYVFLEYEHIRFLVINTVKFHSNKEAAARGKVNDTQLKEIREYLTAHKDAKLQVALCHHHPVMHSRFNLGEDDVIASGADLVDILNEQGIHLLIHGHKHDPWLRYSGGNNSSFPIFSSGSFSAQTNLMVSPARNTFHTIEISRVDFGRAKGIIRTWEYLFGIGWRRADSGDELFPQNAGFGFSGAVEELVESTITLIDGNANNLMNWEDFLARNPNVEYLTPAECKKFREMLSEREIITHPELPKRPDFIGRISSGI